MNTPKRVGLKGVVATVTLFTLLQIVTTSGHGVQLMFQGNAVANHGFVLLEQIRDNPDDANPDTVIVQTDNTDCCTNGDGLSAGNWFFPNGTAVPTNSVGYDFFFDRRTQRVHLSRRRGGVLGIYRCSRVPDASGINCDRYVGIYSANTGRPLITSITFNLISERNAETPRFTLTCISGGGPVERVDWLRATNGGSSLQDGSTYDISGPTVVDTESAIYHHTLTVTGRLPDRYTCRVFSTRPLTAGGLHVDTMDIDVVAAHPPTNVSTELVGGTSCNDIRVSWTPPTGGATVTGYRIYYQAEGHQGFHDVENGSATVDTVTGLLSGSTYTITMVARSQHLPSVASDSVTMAVGAPSIASLHFEMLSEVNATTPVFTLTCISQDGPVRRVQWIRNGETLNTDTDFDTSQPVLVNISSLTYHSVLTVNGRLPGFYTCRVTSARTAVPGGRCSDNHSLQVGAPHSVTNLSARRISCDTVTVSWTPPTGGATVTGYRIYYQAEGHQELNVTVNNPSTDEYNIRNLQVNLRYQITMVALSRHLPSPLAGPETVTIAPPPVRPNISLRIVYPTSVRVSWSPQPHVDHYEVTIERKNHTLEECPLFHHISETVDKMDTDHTFQGLQEFSNYSITVRAVNLCGRPFSSQCITTPSAAPSAAPQTPTAQAISSTEIYFQWSGVPCIEQNSKITAYTVHYGPVSNPGDIEKITVVGSSSDGGSYNISSLHPFTNYSIQVAAQNSDGEIGPFSNPTIETTCQDAPGPVQSLSALPQATSIQVSWQVPNQTNGIIIAYEVHYWRNGEERQTENVTSGTSVELVALIPESEYSISVRAYTIAGPGPWRTAQSSTLQINPVENIEAVTVNATALSVSWSPTVLPGWTVTHYTVYYSAMSAQGNKIAHEYTEVTPGNTTSAVVIASDIFPDLVHQFQVTASLEIEGEVFEGRKSPPLRISFDKALFQLQFGLLADCSCCTWSVEKASRIKATLNSHLVKALSFHCNCSFSADFLREGAFICWTTPTMTTYRSTIVGTKTHNASQLVAVLQQWVTSEPVLEIDHLYVKVNADCPASISSLADTECS